MAEEGKFDVRRPRMGRPMMVNGFWPEAERAAAEAAATELQQLGMWSDQVQLAQTGPGLVTATPERGNIITWIKSRLTSGEAEPEEVDEPPVVLRTWPDEGRLSRCQRS